MIAVPGYDRQHQPLVAVVKPAIVVVAGDHDRGSREDLIGGGTDRPASVAAPPGEIGVDPIGACEAAAGDGQQARPLLATERTNDGGRSVRLELIVTVGPQRIALPCRISPGRIQVAYQ